MVERPRATMPEEASMEIRLERGDITQVDVDAIVNAANEAMLGGGGVDGAIHRAAGPRLLEACAEVPADAQGRRCPTGEARLTPGFDLPARYVIHTVGPVWGMDPDAEGALARAHRSVLTLAQGVDDIRTIAFPAISCGIYGFPMHRAAPIALGVAREQAWDLDELRFVMFDERAYAAWERALRRSSG